MKLGCVLFIFLLPMAAQISPPREKPSGYPAHAAVPRMELAAEYLVHSLPGPRGVIFIKDYLIVEVAAYPAISGADWKADQFALRINKKGTGLLPQAPGMVAASVKYPNWQQRPTVIAGAGIDDKTVSIGQPPTVGRFPGDPTTSRPIPSRVPEPESPTGEGQPLEMTIDEICRRQALHDGSFRKPVNGFLYFEFSGKLKSIHALELLYETADGTKATLTLL
jgi:hypothetical protein